MNRKALALICALTCTAIFAPALAHADAGENFSYNVHVNPIGLLVDEIDGGFDFAISDYVSLGPTLMYFNYSSSTLDGVGTANAFGAGARATFFLNGNAIGKSWIIVAQALYLPSLNVSGTDGLGDTFSATLKNTTLLQAMFGYQWAWKSGFNMDAAIGIGYYTSPGTFDYTDNAGNPGAFSVPEFHGTDLAAEFNLGWAF